MGTFSPFPSWHLLCTSLYYLILAPIVAVTIIVHFDISCSYCRLEHVHYYIKLETELFHKYIWAYVTKIMKSKIEDEDFLKPFFLIALCSHASSIIDWSLCKSVGRYSALLEEIRNSLSKILSFSPLCQVLLRTNISLEQITLCWLMLNETTSLNNYKS